MVPFSLHFKLSIVIGVVTINSSIPQMLLCVLCYPFVIQVDVRNLFQGKNKRFLNYNNQHGTNSLKKHTFDEHLEMCKR